MKATKSRELLCNHLEWAQALVSCLRPHWQHRTPMATVEEQETDELRDFRESWKREVQERKWQQQQSLQDSADSATVLPEETLTSGTTGDPHRSVASQLRDHALDVYTGAVKHEQAGQLDEALRLYRQAFRMDSNVDRAYHLREKRASRTLEATAPTATSPERNAEKEAGIFVRSGSDAPAPRAVHANNTSTHHHPEPQRSGLLAEIVAGFPMPLSFEPEDEKAPSPLQRLPDELLVYLVSYLGVAAIERFARVSRKARTITLDATIWRSDFLLPLFPNPQHRSTMFPNLFLFPTTAFSARCHRWTKQILIVHLFHRGFVKTIYKPPQISPDDVLDDIVEEHSSDYRRVYIERPRVRLDGVYIAVCHYMYLPVKDVHVSYYSSSVADGTG